MSCRSGLCPGLRWENLQRSLDPLAKLGERKGNERRNDGKEEGGERRGR